MKSSKIEFDLVAPGTGDHQIVGPSAKRVAITFFPPIGGEATLSSETIAAFGQGLQMSQTGQPFTFTLARHGDIVQRAWRAFYSVGASSLGWIQTIA